ncbi:hypothetical protein [Amycolatopsis sp. NBC_00438]|uniref:hypothetical protein n=1 Tax=Amycolatopsis sp. NBC_00438 TaxID=2903558 RepID=UPI002E1CE543
MGGRDSTRRDLPEAGRQVVQVQGIEFLWYIPNQAEPGHRGDDVTEDHDSLAASTRHAEAFIQSWVPFP